MGDWGSGERDGFGRLTLNLAESKLREGCGTSACGLGWVASTKEANEAGLHLTLMHKSGIGTADEMYAGSNNYSAVYQKPGTTDVEKFDLDAAVHYFEFQYIQTAYLLFTPIAYSTLATTPVEVANRMRDLLESGEQVFLRKLAVGDLIEFLPLAELNQMLA